MKLKMIRMGKEARSKLQEGINLVADIIKTTLGPKGRNVIVSKLGPLPPRSMNDGYYIADHIQSEDPIVNAGVEMVKEICKKTNDVAGDGPQPKHSKVLTPTGFKKLGDIKIGDKICGTNGTIQEVLGVFEKGKKEIYKIEFSDSRIVECCKDHLWTVINTDHGVKKTITLNEILEKGIYYDKTNGYRNYKYYVPISKAEFYEKQLLLDPYTLGVLIGDGSLSQDDSTEISIGLNKEHIIKKLNFPEGIETNIRYIKDKNYFRIKIVGKTNNGKTIRDILREIGLNGSLSSTKFIPKEYLYSSIKSREALLYGLSDTDGHINKRNLLEYSTISEKLYYDVLELLRGLGKSTYSYLKDKTDANSYSDKSIYVICELKGYKYGNKIISIEPTGNLTDMMCIKVSNADNLYYTDNYILTHNTTSTAILSQSLIEAGLREVDKGKNPVDIKKELNEDLVNVLEELKTLSKPIETAEDIKNIATISGNNDTEIGDALKEIYEKVGKNASIMAEKSSEAKIRTETIKGIYFGKGFDEARAFVNNPVKMTAEYKDISILCVDEKLEYLDDIQPFIQKLVKYYEELGKSSWDIRLLVIANELPVRMDAMSFLAENNKAAMTKQVDEKGNPLGFYCIGVEAPEFGPTRVEILEDIAIATGGIYIAKTNGLTLKDANPKKVLGRAEKVIVNTNSTTIIGGNADKKLLQERIDMLKGETDQLHTNAKITREKFEQRLQVISAGVGIIYAGAPTEVESRERHLRIEDAVLAVKSAIEEGVSVGGGFTYFKLANKAKTNMLRQACLSIPEQVAENAGKTSLGIIEMMKAKNLGYNALTDKFEDLSKSGVLDSTKVIRVALENAVSLASLFLTTSSAIIEYVKDEEVKK